MKRIFGAGRAVPTRRAFLRAGALAVLALPVLPVAAAFASTPGFVPPRRMHGRARVNVRDTGARGDGVHDDTAAFQRAIDSLPAQGGTVEVPAGDYLIDPVRQVRLRSRMYLKLAPQAKLVAEANAADRSYVLLVEQVEDVEVSGGSIVGDRDRHLGSTGEWGHGIAVRGASRVTVRDIRISRCWGDGISIGGTMVGRGPSRQARMSEDVVVSRVACIGNRRQGLTIGRSRGVRVHDSEFSDTAGTKPECGIDVEPDRPGSAQDVHIENCLVRGNRGSGIQLYWRTSDITVRRCTIERNGGFGILGVFTVGGAITGNQIHDNGLFGIKLSRQSSRYRVSGNRFRNNAVNSQRVQARRALKGAKRPRTASQLGHIDAASDTSSITIADNQYLDG